MSKYTKYGKRDREESSKCKSPTKIVNITITSKEASNKEDVTPKGKHQHIAFIARGVPRKTPRQKR